MKSLRNESEALGLSSDHASAADPRSQLVCDERRLVARLLKGEREAWREFVDQYQRVVFARVKHVLVQAGSPAGSIDCDDVVADLFASLLTNNMKVLRKFEHRSTLATWLTIIAHRMSLRAASKSRRRVTIVNETNAHVSQSSAQSSNQWLAQLAGDPAENPLEQLLNFENRSKIHNKLALLKPADRQVIELYHFESLSYREIARRMGISENSVGPRLTRALRRLKRLLEDAK